MRYFLLFVLVAVPLLLLSWMFTRQNSHEQSQLTLKPQSQQSQEAAAPAPGPSDPEDRRLLALLVPIPSGLKAQAQPALYDEKGLFDYINGAAPVFIDRGFRKLLAGELATPGGGELTCDIYDMRSSKNATAIYQKERPAKAAWATFGDESHLGSMSLVFRKDRFYIKLTAFDADAEGQLSPLATTLIARISGDDPVDGAAEKELSGDDLLRALFKTPLPDATIDGELTLYDDKGLFDYINGAAPVFIERGFRQLAAADLVTNEGGEFTCDVYDMQTAENASAIYSKEKPATATAADYGEESHVGSMALVFRQGPFYIKMTAFDADAEVVLGKLASTLLERIP